MRSRLILAFGLLAVIVVGAFIGFRTISIHDLAEDDLRDQVGREALLLATLVESPDGLGDDGVTPQSLAPFAEPDRWVIVTTGDLAVTEAGGTGWDDADPSLAVTGSATVGETRVVVLAPERDVEEQVAAALPSLLVLGGVLVVFALLLGALIATGLSRPFAQLATAANALARGRSDVAPPTTRIAEAREIGTALVSAAAAHAESLRRERDLSLRASHELRTPLTSLRLVLHELTDRDDAPDDLLEVAAMAAKHVDRLDAAVDAVLEETRSHPVLQGAQLPLHLVVPALAQRWADTLALADVPLEAELLGDDDLLITPGPLEQLLDDVLQAVLTLRGRSVRLSIGESEGHLRVTVRVGEPAVPQASLAATHLRRATEVADTVGGRVGGDLADEQGLVVVLPGR